MSVVRNGTFGHSRRECRDQTLTFTPAGGDDELRQQVHKLEYELGSLKQERELSKLRHEEEIRVIQAKAEEDYNRAQASESSTTAASSRYESLAAQLDATRENAAQERNEFEAQTRSLRDRNTALEEEVEEGRAEISRQERGFKRDISDLQAKCEGLERESEESRQENERQAKALETAQTKLLQREDEVGRLENEVMRLKAQTGDADTLNIIKRELSEQVDHIKKLEAVNNDQRIELKQYRKAQKSIQVVEEEKRALESKVSRMDDLRRELNEAQLQKSILEEEKREWASYLESENGRNDNFHFETPHDLARAFMQERLERVSLIDQLGRVRPELSAKDEIISSLERDKSSLQTEIDGLKQNGNNAPDAKARARLERQRTLAQKEVDYLREQIKAFDSEEAELNPEKYDESKGKRISELETLVDEHRKELQQLHNSMSQLELSAPSSTPASSPLKRPRPDDSDDRLGELLRKSRNLQDELTSSTNARQMLAKELEVTKSQLRSLKKGSSQRILELRNNPTAHAASIKQATLDALRAENDALLAKRAGHADQENRGTVPSATLDRLRHDLAAKDAELQSKDKHALRLRQIFAAKSNEFREAVASILGWKLDFMPNGRVRVTSMFYPGPADEADEGNSIVFDGEQGTMKVSGGPQSAFAGEIRGQIEFWVEGRKEIPCFLAALTLEFWERTTRAQKV